MEGPLYQGERHCDNSGPGFIRARRIATDKSALIRRARVTPWPPLFKSPQSQFNNEDSRFGEKRVSGFLLGHSHAFIDQLHHLLD
jgi:hypothetical protein